MLAVHRPLTAGGRSSNGGSVASVLGGQEKRRRSALNAVANARRHSSRTHLSTMENRGTNLEQLQARAAVVEKQSTDETPMTSNPKVDALELTLENLPKDDYYDDVRAVLVDKHRDAVLEAMRMKPLGARLDDCEAGSWKSCQATSRGRGHHQNCRGGETQCCR